MRVRFAAIASLSVFAFVGSTMSGCNDVKTPPPPPDPCSGMPTAPPENGYPVGICPFWIVPPNADPPGTCPAAIAGFVDAPLPGSDINSAVACRYAWANPAVPPTPMDLAALPAGALPDCTYVTAQASADAILTWARDELRNAAGAPLGANKDGVAVRAIVLDTVPEAPMWPLPQGAQHGLTLSWMMQNLACSNSGSCPFQVRTALGMPRQIDPQSGRPVINPNGGSFGLLSDVTEALWSELRRYRDELRMAALTPMLAQDVPLRLLVVSAFGFDNEPMNQVCDEKPNLANGAVRAMYDAYVAASCLGALHVAAAGNSSGGDDQHTGMLCPARWDKAIAPTNALCQSLWGTAEWAQIQMDYAAVVDAKAMGAMASIFTPAMPMDPTDHLLSVGGVDYQGQPLVLSRPGACSEAVALGLGGIGWISEEQVPPVLTGTSVSAALAAARIGVRWYSELPTVATDLVKNAIGEAKTIPFVRDQNCDNSERIACMNELPWLSEPAMPVVGQNPPGNDPVREALAARPDRISIDPPGEGICTAQIPHCVLESRAATTDVWPQPVDPICVKCGVYIGSETISGWPELWIDGNPSIPLGEFTGAAFIVESEKGGVILTKPLNPSVFLGPATIALTDVPFTIFDSARAWLSVYAPDGRTVSQQIFVVQ